MGPSVEWKKRFSRRAWKNDAAHFGNISPRVSSAGVFLCVQNDRRYRMSNGIDKARREVSGYRSGRRKVAASTINLIAKSRSPAGCAPNAGAIVSARCSARCIRRADASAGIRRCGGARSCPARTLRNPASCERRARTTRDAGPRKKDRREKSRPGRFQRRTESECEQFQASRAPRLAVADGRSFKAQPFGTLWYLIYKTSYCSEGNFFFNARRHIKIAAEGRRG